MASVMQATKETSDELMLIERFASEDLSRASQAFEALAPKLRIVVGRLLSNSLPRIVDREDVAEVVLQRLWQNRTRFEPRSVAAWWRYVGTTARRCALDHRVPEIPAEIDDASAEQPAIASWFDPARLYEGADELWLKVDPKLSTVERDRRLFAAQLCVLAGRSRECVAAWLGVPTNSIDGWLSSESVLLRLSYRYLYVGNDRLTGFLLSVPYRSSELDKLTFRARERQGEPPAGWTWEEAHVAILRFRNCLTEAKIAQMLEIEVQEVERVTQICVERLPMLKRALELRSKLRRGRYPTKMLSSIDLWRRVVFQYHASDALPQRQILERTSKPAEALGYVLNAGILNSWLSNRRILDQLLEYLSQEQAND